MSEGTVEQRLKLLLIDDEKVIHDSIGTFLEKMGYTVLHTDSAEQGLAIFAGERPDVVISDIKMPGMDGLELLERLSGRALDLEVILITGHGDMQSAITALRKGAFDFLRKPVKPEDLLACLQRTQRYQQVCRERDRIQEKFERLVEAENVGRESGELIGESNLIERTVILAEDSVLGAADFPGLSSEDEDENPGAEKRDMLESLDLAAHEERLIDEARRRCEGKQIEAAKLLGISDDALCCRMKKYGIEGK